MKNKKLFIINVIILAVLIIATVLSWEYWFNREKTIKAPFTCDNGKLIEAVFYPDNDTRVDLKLSDGRSLSVPKTISASGIRYANQDESFVFWNKGNTAFITENGQNTYDNCIVAGSEDLPQVQSISDSNIKINYNNTFGLAVTKDQILVKSYIPACDENFDYCLYYYTDTYKGTNFESAGLRVKKRIDLSSITCLTTPPEGFNPSMQPDATNSSSAYSMSFFSNVSGAAAGHYSSGSLYRLYIKENGACYEFETRIGQSQFANYPEGSIKEFTDKDSEQVRIQLINILEEITLKDGQTLQLPK